MRLALSELILDYKVYPRTRIDSVNVAQMREAIAAGVTLPPILICRRTRRIVDGAHRYTVYMSMFGPQYVVEVIEMDFEGDADLFAEAVRLNATHGHKLGAFDRAHIIVKATEFNITVDTIAAILCVPIKTIETIELNRMALYPANGHSTRVPIKASIAHMRGRELTPGQQEANRHLSGMHARFHANQLLLLIRNDLIDLSREGTRDTLAELAAELGRFAVAA